jgi:hypothetical protein
LIFPHAIHPSVRRLSQAEFPINAGATLVVESTGPDANPLQTGSAQLATNGNISGFAIFRYEPTGQEAVVPLESRNASSCILAFDNTGGTATGVAVSSSSLQAVSVPVVIRDDSGTQIGVLGIPAHTFTTLPQVAKTSPWTLMIDLMATEFVFCLRQSPKPEILGPLWAAVYTDSSY